MTTTRKLALSVLALAALLLSVAPAMAQCGSCPQPVVAAYAPVAVPTMQVYQQPRTGWYPGYLIDRLFGGTTTVAPTAYAVPQTYAAPTPYTASYAPVAYSAGYAPMSYTAAMPVVPAAPSCGCEVQTAYRPIVMSPVSECTTCYAPAAPCSPCGGTTITSYGAPASTGCSTCGTGAVVMSQPTNVTSGMEAPSLAPVQPMDAGSALPPNTFRKEPTLAPPEVEIPASGANTSGASAIEGTNYWQRPKLWDTRDRVTQATTVPVRQALYHQPAASPSTSTRSVSTSATGGDVKWVSGR